MLTEEGRDKVCKKVLKSKKLVSNSERSFSRIACEQPDLGPCKHQLQQWATNLLKLHKELGHPSRQTFT